MPLQWKDGKLVRGPYGPRRGADGRTALARERLRRGLTQQQAAELLGVDRSQLAGYESGARTMPKRGWRNPAFRRRLADFLAGQEILPLPVPGDC